MAVSELEIAPESVAYQAKEVQLLLSKEIVKQAFAATELRIMKQWKLAETVAAREWCRAKIDAFQELQQELRGLVQRNLQIAKE